MVEALYWSASIFVWLFITGIGLPPVPEEAGILYAASVTSLHEHVRWWMAWPACALGIICADCVLYGVGRRWGTKLFEYRWVQKILSTEKRQRLEGHFANHGMKLLVLARFLPPLRTGVFLIAGATRYSFLKFMIADLLYAVFGVGLLFFFGKWVIAFVEEFKSTALFLGALAVMAFGLYQYFLFLRRREQKGEPQPPVSILQGPEGSVPEGESAKDAVAAPAARQEANAALQE